MRGLVRSLVILFAFCGTSAWAQSSVQVHAALPEAAEPAIEQQASEPVQEQGSQQPQGQGTEQATEPKSAPTSEQKPQEKADQRHEQPAAAPTAFLFQPLILQGGWTPNLQRQCPSG